MIENQENQLYFLEKEAKIRNIVFFGIEENENSYAELEKMIIIFVENYFSIKLDIRDIQVAKRLGKKTEKPRPICVTFLTLGIKIDILRGKKTLNETPYYVTEDYPKNILERRRELQKQINIERENGNTAFIKYDKLIVIPNKPETSNHKKRKTLPASPENLAYSQTEHRNNAPKKSKALPNLTKTQKTASTSERILKPGILNYLVSKNSAYTQENNNKD